MRIAVWLKIYRVSRYCELPEVSIRRADRCLVEVRHTRVSICLYTQFQSAVRIAVWLKFRWRLTMCLRISVSIRRADRCLVEVLASYFLDARHTDGFNPPCGSLFG